MKRIVEPELLDHLSPDDPRAIHSRRDLQRINRLLDHAGILARLLLETIPPPRRLVELGAGDGTCLLAVARRLSRHWPGVEVVLVDRQEAPSLETRAGFAAAGWPVEMVKADVFDWLPRQTEAADAMMANLFLHHFAANELGRLLQLVSQRANFFVACETLRSPAALAFSHLVGLIGCNAVTRHDAVASVRAGFAGRELSARWPDASDW